MNEGYGSSMTSICIKENILVKKAISKKGEDKIKKEMDFYKAIKNSDISALFPNILHFDKFSFEMEYLNEYTTLYEYLKNNNNPDELFSILKSVDLIINSLRIKKLKVDKKKIKEYFMDETYHKIIERYKEIDHIIKDYKHITEVNGYKVLKLTDILAFIESFVNTEEYHDNFFYFFHGDLHLNNILINPQTKNIKLIDPRGFFSELSCFGPKEYERAKLLFGLSGYSDFDIKKIENLNASNNNINLPNFTTFKELNFKQKNWTNFFLMCIWLGNAHSFKKDRYKLLTSYYYSLYISSKFINNWV